MGKASRDKGKRYEQALARAYRAAGFDVSRNSNQAHTDAPGEDPKGDILGVDAGWLRLHVQAKNQERLNIWAALRQAEAEAPEGFVPSVHFTRNYADSYVAVPLDFWIRTLQLLREMEVSP